MKGGLLHMKIVLYVEVCRNGVGAFLVHLFGYKKSIRQTVGLCCGEGLATALARSLRLTPFPSARRGAPCKEQRDSNGGAVTDEVA